VPPLIRNPRPDYPVGSILLGGKHVLTTTCLSGMLPWRRSSQVGQVGDRTVSFNADGLASVLASMTCPTQRAFISSVDPQLLHRAYTNQSNSLCTRMQINTGSRLS